MGGQGAGSWGDMGTLVQGCSASSRLATQLSHPGGEPGYGVRTARPGSGTKGTAGAEASI